MLLDFCMIALIVSQSSLQLSSYTYVVRKVALRSAALC